MEIQGDGIRAEAAIDLTVPPEQAVAIYLEVSRWGQIFPATISQARVLAAGENWMQIEVDHKVEGKVPNTVKILSRTEIRLEENKKRYEASFLNRFQPGAGGGTRYTVTARIRLKGFLRALQPFLAGYVRRKALNQIRHNVLEPVKRAAERGISTP